MKKITIVFFIAATLFSGGLKAQTTLSLSEMNPYFDAYMEPFAGAMAVGMSGGWTNTAGTHELLGFDISFSGTLVNMPSNALTFDAEALNMPGIDVIGNPGGDPTISASKDLTAPSLGKEVVVNGVGSGTFYFDGVKGLGLNKGGNVALQAGIGLPKGTDLMVRYVPDVSTPINSVLSGVGDIELSSTGLWGVGVKHDIKQWIPVVKSVPFLQLSAMLNYSSFKSGFSGDDLRFDPERLGANDETGNPQQWNDQKFDFKMTSFNGSLLIGANIPIFQPFIAIGFNSAKFDGGFYGNYPVLTLNTTGTGSSVADVYESEKDPLSVDFKETNFNFQAGARLKLGVFVMHYTYTIQTFSMHTAGIAFTFR